MIRIIQHSQFKVYDEREKVISQKVWVTLMRITLNISLKSSLIIIFL